MARERLAEITKPAPRRHHAQERAGETPWSAYVSRRVTDGQVALAPVPAFLTEPVRKAAVVLVVCVDLRAVAALDKDLDRVGIIGGASVYPFLWNIHLADRNDGFGGTITTMAVAEEPALKELLGIPDPYALAAVVPPGKPLTQPRKLTRAEISELTHREHWESGLQRG